MYPYGHKHFFFIGACNFMVGNRIDMQSRRFAFPLRWRLKTERNVCNWHICYSMWSICPQPRSSFVVVLVFLRVSFLPLNQLKGANNTRQLHSKVINLLFYLASLIKRFNKKRKKNRLASFGFRRHLNPHTGTYILHTDREREIFMFWFWEKYFIFIKLKI